MTTHQGLSRFAIFPAIGIARVGNAAEEFFLGPEAPGVSAKPAAGFKDAEGRIKRQAARFRVFELDDHGTAVREITTDEADITWRVHVANRKASGYNFENALDLGRLAKPTTPRNPRETDRKKLCIDPGSKTIRGRSQPAVRLDGGAFRGKPVSLGELRTDEQGRLIVLGGLGLSASSTAAAATTFANNDDWHDDTSDGTVRATLVVNGTTFEAEPAMVAVAPPNYGQGLYGVVTMYDLVYDLVARTDDAVPHDPDFWRHIAPVLRRLSATQWLNSGVFLLFGHNSPADFSEPTLLARLADPRPVERPLRQRVFEWFRDPAETVEHPEKLPPFYGDAFDDYQHIGLVGLALTRTQYRWFQRWAAGHFSSGPEPVPHASLEAHPIPEQPHALNRANLEDCLGGPFHPGIELTWTLRVPTMWKAPYRLKLLPEGASPREDYGPVLTPEEAMGPGGVAENSGPGSLTRWMGVPWQTDEASCDAGYSLGSFLRIPSFWAARVPNHVLPHPAYERLLQTNLPAAQRAKHFSHRPAWLRYFGPDYRRKINDMVQNWDKVGIVTEQPGPADAAAANLPAMLWVETGVHGDYAGDDPTLGMVPRAEALPTTPPAMGAPAPMAAAPPAAPSRRRTLRRDEL